MALKPMELAPELSIRSGGLPLTNLGCNSWLIWVDGDTLIFAPRFFCDDVAGEGDVVVAVPAVEDHRVDGGSGCHVERVRGGGGARRWMRRAGGAGHGRLPALDLAALVVRAAAGWLMAAPLAVLALVPPPPAQAAQRAAERHQCCRAERGTEQRPTADVDPVPGLNSGVFPWSSWSDRCRGLLGEPRIRRGRCPLTATGGSPRLIRWPYRLQGVVVCVSFRDVGRDVDRRQRRRRRRSVRSRRGSGVGR